MKNRKNYWNNDYTKYWKKKVLESNENLDNDKTSTDQFYHDAIELLKIQKKDTILEMGVGFGRSLPFVSMQAFHVYALDISKYMIEEAKKNSSKNITYVVSPSENTPFEINYFDKIICFACFDAMYQNQALLEMNRICKNNGTILITGKNDNYPTDDNLAYEAEIGARKKNHPNYFTDFACLLKNLDRFGFEIKLNNFFEYRGDFGKQKYVRKIPNKFYEYLIILKKTKSIKKSVDLIISSEISKTFKKINISK